MPAFKIPGKPGALQRSLRCPERVAIQCIVDADAELELQTARELTRLRRAQGLTQGELARALGLSQAALSRLERGKQRLPVDLLARWALELGTRGSAVLAAAGGGGEA